jgi:hypothetical protein
MSIDVSGDSMNATLRWFNNSPPVNSWLLLCSLCGIAIRPSDGPPLRAWNRQGQEARLHRACFALLRNPPCAAVEPFLEQMKTAPPLISQQSERNRKLRAA